MNHTLKKIKQSIQGEISVSEEDIEYYSTDGGVFELTPNAIVFPVDANDVTELVKTVASMNERGGDKLSITARGNGTDQGGGPLNTGLIVDFTKHMNHILEIGDDFVLVEPGCRYGHLQAQLKKRGRFIPSYPASVEVSTIGGAVANNAAGEKTVKYGSTRDYVEALQVVLSNGETVWVHANTLEEVNTKKSTASLESKIYSQIQELLNGNIDTIHNDHPNTTKESAGYALWKAQTQGGGINLAQIVTGSQGTLCLVTAIRLKTIPLPKNIVLAVSYFDSLEKAGNAAMKLHELEPSALEIVDKNLLELVSQHKPELLEGLLPETMPAIVLLTEFDDAQNEIRSSKLGRAQSVFDELAFESIVKQDPDEQAKLWKLRRSAAAVMWTIPGSKKALPIIEDGTVPPDRLVDFLHRAYQIFEKHNLEIAVWGHAGDADLHMQPFMDLSTEADRKKLFEVTDDFYAMVAELGGTAAGEHNDSLMRAPYRAQMFSPAMEDLFNQVKHIFDPDNLFNPHKKVGVDFNYVKQHLRHEYSIKSLEHMKRQQAQDAIDK